MAARALAKVPDIDISLHPAQAQVFSSMANEIFYGGAAGGGKSHLIRLASIIWAMQVPGLQIYLFRRNFPDLNFNHMSGPTSFPMLLGALIDSKYVIWHKTDHSFEFWNGSVIRLCHCQREDDRFKYLGAEIHVLLIDELSQFTPTIYNFLRTRVRMTGITVPAGVFGTFPKILCASNPGGACHNFMKQTWIDPVPPYEYFQAPSDEGGMVRQFIPARLVDNPTLAEQDPKYSDRIRGLGDANLVKAYLEGDFNVVVGGIFDDLFDLGTHVVDPFVIPYSWYVDRAFDWGSAKPFSIGWWAESDGSPAVTADGEIRHYAKGTLFQIGEWYGWNGKYDQGLGMPNRDIALGIKEIEADLPFRVHAGPADASIFDVENGHCIVAEFEDEGVFWTKADKSAGSRIHSIQEIRSRLNNASKHPRELPGIFFFSNCRHSIRTLPTAPRDDKKFDDIDGGYEDHAIDQIRYRVRGDKQIVRAFSNPVA